MESVKYIGLDVHQSTISAAVLNAEGQLAMQSILATQAGAILDYLGGLRGSLHVTFEEGTHSAWLYDLLVRRVARLVVCNPRKNALLKSGSKSDAIDARKLAELLRAGMLSPVYHGERNTVALKQFVRSYAALTEDSTRVMRRIKALYRSQAIPCAGKKPYSRKQRQQWLEKLQETGLRRRGERLYQELDALQELRREARHDVLSECRKHEAVKRTVYGAVSEFTARGRVGGARGNAPPIPHQTSVLGLLRTGAGDARKRRVLLCERPIDAQEKTGIHSWAEPESQSRSEEPV